MTYKAIGVIGDSITNGYFDEKGLGWFGRFSQKVAVNFPLQYGFNNMSQSGDRICDAYHRVASETSTRELDILIFAVGINDIVRRGNHNAPEDLSPLLRSKYWNKCFELSQNIKVQTIVLDILPVIETENGVKYDEADPSLFYLNKDVIEYNKILKKNCAERDITFIERYQDWEKRNLKELYQDSAHPNSQGHQLIADEIYEKLIKLKVIK